MTRPPFDFIYEDSDDSIHLPVRGHKRQFEQDTYDPQSFVGTPMSNFAIPDLGSNMTFNASNLKKVPNLRETSKSLKRRRSGEKLSSDSLLKNYRVSNNVPTPEVVLKQLHLQKADLGTVFQAFCGLQCVLPCSGDVITLDDRSLGSLRSDIPVLMFFFDFANVSWLKFFELFREKNIKVLAVTPHYDYFNPQSFPIILDKDGLVTKLLSIQNPVGGGVFPIPSIFLFDKYQQELMRIKLGYDYDVYYSSNVSNSLQKVLCEAVDYTLGI